MTSSNRTFPNKTRAGFTILEILVAMTLLTIILSIVYMTFATVIQSTEDARAASFEMRTRQFLTRSFASNLNQTTEGWSPGSAYRSSTNASQAEIPTEEIIGGGTARYWFDGKSDSLSFVSTAPLAGNAALPGFIKLVTYEIGSEKSEEDILTDFGAEPQATLEVTETPLALSSGATGIGIDLGSSASDFNRENVLDTAQRIGMKSVSWNIPIDTISFLYFDGNEWVDTWDSALFSRMPWAVDIRINFPTKEETFESERDPEADPDFRLVLTIPIGAGVHDAPPDYVRPNESSRQRGSRS